MAERPATEDSGSSRLRRVSLPLSFVVLALLGVALGVHRLDTIRDRSYQRTLDSMAYGHGDLARTVTSLLDGQRHHARYLSRLGGVRAMLVRPTGDVRDRLDAQLPPYMVAFRSIDKVRVFDANLREVLRYARTGRDGGVSVAPAYTLGSRAEPAVAEMANDLDIGEVAQSALVIDENRVEVTPSERQVIHHVAGIADGDARVGYVVVTVYASPILSAVREFAPIPGVMSFLIDEKGTYLAHADRDLEVGRGTPGNVLNRPDGREILGAADGRVPADERWFLTRIVCPDPQWRLVSEVPISALDSAAGDLATEYAWVTGTVVVITMLLASAAFLTVRLGVREVELRERERKKELEKQLQVSERLGALGMLTAGVAHEVNNPLEGIGNYLALLEREKEDEEKRARYVGQVRHGFERIRDIVRDLSDFARPEIGEGSADLKEVVEKALKLAAYDKTFKGVEVDVSGLDGPVTVPGDPSRLEQVILNLLLNAARAQSGSGEEPSRAARVVVSVAPATRIGKPVMEVAIDDNGPGIAPEHLDKLFDPFFTTTGGLGLGLAISHSIVTAHGGTLTAENRASGGARFLMRLPRK